MTGSSTIRSAIPVLPSLDIEATVEFWRDKLGFEISFAHDDYAGVEREGVQVHFWLCEDPDLPRNSSCRLNVRGIRGLYDELSAKSVIHPNDPLADKPWGFREFTALDRDGNAIVFAEELTDG